MDKKAEVKIPVILGKGLLGSCIISAVAIFIMALLLLKTGISEKTLHIVIIAVYVISCFLSGLYCGKKIKTRRFLWGLMEGILYFAVLGMISLIMNKGQFSPGMAATSLICLGSGMLGGMIS